jgi:hypothetical protein
VASSALDTARDALTLTRESGMTAIDDAETAQASYDSATELMTMVRQLADDFARKRATAAARIRSEEALSLAGLAGRLSMSKTRASDLMKLAEEGGSQ